MHYTIASSEHDVNRLIQEGFEPIGGVTVIKEEGYYKSCDRTFYQAMIKKDPGIYMRVLNYFRGIYYKYVKKI
jgi:hypothetical protein